MTTQVHIYHEYSLINYVNACDALSLESRLAADETLIIYAYISAGIMGINERCRIKNLPESCCRAKAAKSTALPLITRSRMQPT